MSDQRGDFDDVDLGDARLDDRAALILRLWGAAPEASFPTIANGAASLQGLYGFVENETVDYRELLEAHVDKTVQRIREHGDPIVLILHDTTTFTLPGAVHRDGLGWVTATKQGFHGHFSLAVSADGSRCPLGVVGLSIHIPPHRGAEKRKKLSAKQRAADPGRDTRWIDAGQQTGERLRGVAVPVHIMDRAGDGYEIMAVLTAQNQRFVIRGNFDRRVLTQLDGDLEAGKLRAVVERAVPVTAREVQLSRRRASHLPDANKKHAPRDARVAKLVFATARVRLSKTKYLGEALPETIDVNVVHVREVDVPEGAAPVDWLLLTNEPIATEEDILRVVDYYRARWTIEEFFKAIKTGCSYEQRQLESAHALLVALALCIPIAWQLLAVRHQSRHKPDRPASQVIDAERLAVLIAITQDRAHLSSSPTVEEACYAIAALGGHIRRNGPPGWRTLRDGMERLLLAELGWNARGREKM
jgi:hypothetical protein